MLAKPSTCDIPHTYLDGMIFFMINHIQDGHKGIVQWFVMLSHESLVQTISDIIYDHIKGKHKDKIATQLAEEIIDALELEEPPSWYIHG
jgi:hypothetical protein